jgi:hypothetical protein
MTTLPKVCERGASFRVDYGKKGLKARVWHVRGVVDGRAVCRTWQAPMWSYELHPASFFFLSGHRVTWLT